jgi:hypothetical protein
MPSVSKNTTPFAVMDCALVSIATGVRVQNLRELRDTIPSIPAGCLFHHFWGTLLRPRFDVSSFRNDFAEWAVRGLNDLVLGERLALIDPADHRDLEGLRQELLEVVEERLDEREHVPWARSDQLLHYVRSQIVVFDTQRRIERPEQLPETVPRLTVGSVFYHFIDARRRTPDGVDDFRAWIREFGSGYDDVWARLADINPYFLTLVELRQKLAAILEEATAGRSS